MWNKKKYLFIDRDGTLIAEPADKQIDHLDKLDFLPGVFSALERLKKRGFEFILVSNQDGLGSPSFPQQDFDLPQAFMLKLLASQGIYFKDILICPHFEHERCYCRKPGLGLVLPFITSQCIDLDNSYVVGDRNTDKQLADNMNIQGIQIGTTGFESWSQIASFIIDKPRMAQIRRQTKETIIDISVNLDDPGIRQIHTGIDFFDHMLDQVAKHAGISMEIKALGDLAVDDHHTVEDVAICLSQTIAQALGDKYGIGRYGFMLPMDETCAELALDLSGRFYCCFEANFSREVVGGLSTEMVTHFFYSFAEGLKANLHVKLRGENTHHMIEGAFKALGQVLKQAIARTGEDIPTTKGVL
ncbi:MAG: bifunctional histidinol-phosphatase/imidazoleglycerol-phosphate dehydratase HisB [Francisellaceae bacterium]